MAPQVKEKSKILTMLQEEVSQKMKEKNTPTPKTNLTPENKLIYIRY